MKRTNTCNELTSADKGKSVTLIGWVQSVRDHGGIIFVDLRDREGITQVVFHPECPVYRDAQKLKDESVIQIFGTVAMRENDTVNPSLKTGEIEVVADNMIIHNVCETLPFPLDNERADKVNEDLRLQYRYLDLRRPRNLNLLRMRHKAAKALREYLDSNGFTEVETPILFKSTPEGAREFLVPSRPEPRAILRAQPVAPAIQANAYGFGYRKILPDGKVLPRRRPKSRQAARIYAG